MSQCPIETLLVRDNAWPTVLPLAQCLANSAPASSPPKVVELCRNYAFTLHFNTGKDQKDNTWVVGQARLFWITRELRTQISFNYSIARCRLKIVKKCDALSNNWPLMIGPDGKETIAFRSRKFIACHSNSSVLNNASVLWCGKKSRRRVLMWGEQKVMFSCSLVKLGEIISISFRKSTVLAVII